MVAPVSDGKEDGDAKEVRERRDVRDDERRWVVLGGSHTKRTSTTLGK